MKILTIWQPWATLVAFGLKEYETRSWSTDYRGPLAIHAAKRPVKLDEVSSILSATRNGGADSSTLETLEQALSQDLPTGAIVAVCELADCQSMSLAYIEAQTALERACGDWDPDRYAWKLTNVVNLSNPIQYRGQQRLRDLDPAIARQIEQSNGLF